MITPYYRDDWVTLYCGDCLEITAWLSADALVTDPPYGSQILNGLGVNYGGYGRRQNAANNSRHAPTSRAREGFTIANDLDTSTRDAALTMWGDRPATIFGSPRMPEPPGLWTDRLVWDKRRPGMNGGPFRYTHESLFVRGMVRSDNATFSVFTVMPDQTDHIHAKPVELMRVLINVCPPGVIADPFAGSGSTLVAAKALGRRAIGVELEERYCKITARRLAQDVLDFSEPA